MCQAAPEEGYILVPLSAGVLRCQAMGEGMCVPPGLSGPCPPPRGSPFTFPTPLCIAGRECLIFIIWFREGPEALSHCMVSMETDLFGGLAVARQWWGRRETYSKARLHKCGGCWTSSPL